MFVLAQVDTAIKAAEAAYGPYAFGLVCVLVLLGSFALFYSKVVKPTQDAAVKVATEQTKQTENLRLTAAHTESALALARAVGEQNDKARDVLQSMIKNV